MMSFAPDEDLDLSAQGELEKELGFEAEEEGAAEEKEEGAEDEGEKKEEDAAAESKEDEGKEEKEEIEDEEIEETLKQLPKRQRARFLLGEFGDDSEGALWTPDIIRYSDADEFIRIVIAVDPAVTSEEDSDETGIIVVGEDRDSGFHVLDDYSGKYTPREMAYTVVSAYRQWKADRVVGEAWVLQVRWLW